MKKSKQFKSKGLRKQSDLIKNRGRYLLLLPAIVFIVVFAYLPMVGMLIAFENYDPVQGIFGSEWVWFDNFKFFFSGSKWIEVTVNTLYLNVMFIITGTLAALAIAILLSELTNKIYVKLSQTFMTLPNFVSWASVALFSVAFLSTDGIINKVLTGIGTDQIEFSTDPSVWRATFIIIRVWKTAGWSSIIYMAAIAGISPDIYEAAKIDGANRFQCIFRVTLPLLKEVVILQLLFSIGSVFRGDFGMIYPFIGDNSLLYPTTDVIDTYVYRAVRTQSDFSKTMAVGIYQSVLGLVMVLVANGLTRRYAPEASLF